MGGSPECLTSAANLSQIRAGVELD